MTMNMSEMFDINRPDEETREARFSPLTPADAPKSQYRRWHLAILVALAVGTFLILTRKNQVPYQRAEGAVFGTFYHITYQSHDHLQDAIDAELKRVDESLSMFNPKSVISRINRNEDVVADSLFSTVFLLAEKVSQATDGAFDITVAPLVNAWGFGFKNGALPDSAQVDSLLHLVGYRHVSLTADGHLVKHQPGVILDCSAVAKGFGVDIVAACLSRHGVENFMVEIGGEVIVSGKNPKGQPWHVGINKPIDDPDSQSNALDTIIPITDIAMATSGNYRNFYTTDDGRRVAHTIDPVTGYPVQHELLSATVLAPTCAEADAFATSFMVMGLQRARVILSRHPELQVYFIYDSLGYNRVFSTISPD